MNNDKLVQKVNNGRQSLPAIEAGFLLSYRYTQPIERYTLLRIAQRSIFYQKANSSSEKYDVSCSTGFEQSLSIIMAPVKIIFATLIVDATANC